MKEVRSRVSGLRLLLALGLTAAAGAFAAPPRAQAAPPCTARYTIPGDGTVLDNDTKLTWQQAVDMTERSWSDASAYCSTLQLPGAGWRLPTIHELQAIVDEEASSFPVIALAAFPDTPSAIFWTSSTDVRQANKLWYVDFGLTNAGTDLVDSSDSGTPHFVRCVR